MATRPHRSGDPRRRAAAQGARPAGPAPAGRRPAPGAPGPARRRIEVASAPAILALSRLPRLVVPVLLGAVLLAGLLLAGSWAWLGAVCLALVAAFVGWLLALSWPVLTPTSRAVRTLVVAALLTCAVLKALGRF